MAERSAKRDHKGYYAALELPPTASADQIKLAFRQKALLVHPDRNQGEGATDAFQHLSEAYRVLMDPQARARYDSGLSRGEGAQTGSGARAPRMEPVACSRCGAVTAQPRYVVFWRAISHGWGTTRTPIQGVFCRRCADRCGLTASAVTWLLGWWGLPLGPVWTMAVLHRNALGGEQPPDLNAGLLRQQARYFLAIGNPALARAALDQGLRLVESPDLHAKLKKLEASMGPGTRGKLVDRWRPGASPAIYLHLLPVAAVVLGVAALLARKAGWW